MAKTRKSSPKPARRTAKAGGSKPAPPGLDWLRMGAVGLICLIVWCLVYGRVSGDAWSIPIEYGIRSDVADAMSDLAGFKAAADGHYWPIVFHNVPQLGAPYVANWNDYPVTEDFLIWGTGVLANIFGLFTASNLLIMMLQVLAGMAFYYAARRLKCEWKWSFAGALFFALAPYGFAHSLHHFVITAYWHIALGIMVCFWLSNGRGLRIGSRNYRIAAAVAVVTGWQNVYYTSIFIQMAGIAMVIQWVRHGWRAALPALSIGTIAFGAFMVMNLDTIGWGLLHGHNPSATIRNYGQMEYYGLKLVDWFMPFPTHRIPAFAALGQQFYELTVLPAEVPPACYFGLAGIGAFLWMAVYTVRAAIGRDRKRVPLEAVLALWTFFYATVGGINGLVGVFGFQLFRSTTRFCIVIFGLSLIFAIRRLSLISKRWPSPWPVVAPLAIAVIGLWEFVPPTAGEDMQLTASVINSDRLFAQSMEATLPQGGMVFQLPVMDYPESPGAGISAYDHFRPYFYTKNLRYSFGSDKGRPQDTWQRVVAAMQPADQVATLERYGFSGIYVNRAGYADHGEAMLAQYKAAGRTQILESPRQDLYCVVLHPSPNPVLPEPGPLFAKGWYPEQDSQNGQRDHLAKGNATLILTNPKDAPVDQYANFYVAALTPRLVTLEGPGIYQSWHVDQQHPARADNLRITLQPGENRFHFSTDQPPIPQGQGPVGYDVINFDITASPKPDQP